MKKETSTANETIAFNPIFTNEQNSNFEQEYDKTWGTKRRLLMITLSRSSEELITAFDGDEGTEVMTSLMEQLIDYEDHLKAGIELVESATCRLFAVANRLDILGSENSIDDKPQNFV